MSRRESVRNGKQPVGYQMSDSSLGQRLGWGWAEGKGQCTELGPLLGRGNGNGLSGVAWCARDWTPALLIVFGLGRVSVRGWGLGNQATGSGWV